MRLTAQFSTDLRLLIISKNNFKNIVEQTSNLAVHPLSRSETGNLYLQFFL